MRKRPFLCCITASALALLLSAQANAQTGAPAPAKADVPPPPKLEKLEEGDGPAITIRQPASRNEITEKRTSGNELKEIKVKSGPSTYTLRPRRGTGNTPADDVVLPEWTVHEFGKTPKEADSRAEPQRLEPKPNAPKKDDK